MATTTTLTNTVAPTTTAAAPPTTAAPPAETLNPLFIFLGVGVLVVLVVVSVYFLVCWPRNAMRDYREAVREEMERDDEEGETREAVRSLRGGMYSGVSKSGGGSKGPVRLPTFSAIQNQRLVNAEYGVQDVDDRYYDDSQDDSTSRDDPRYDPHL